MAELPSAQQAQQILAYSNVATGEIQVLDWKLAKKKPI